MVIETPIHTVVAVATVECEYDNGSGRSITC